MGRTKEEWRIIKKFPDYAVSNKGRVKRLTRAKGTWPERIVVSNTKRGGYPRATLVNRNGESKKISVHQLVAWEFIGNPPKGKLVHHKDGDPENNVPSNLEYVTPAQNTIAEAVRAGKYHYSGLTGRNVRDIRRMSKQGISRKELGKRFGVSASHISRIVRGNRRKEG